MACIDYATLRYATRKTYWNEARCLLTSQLPLSFAEAPEWANRLYPLGRLLNIWAYVRIFRMFIVIVHSLGLDRLGNPMASGKLLHC